MPEAQEPGEHTPDRRDQAQARIREPAYPEGSCSGIRRRPGSPAGGLPAHFRGQECSRRIRESPGGPAQHRELREPAEARERHLQEQERRQGPPWLPAGKLGNLRPGYFPGRKQAPLVPERAPDLPQQRCGAFWSGPVPGAQPLRMTGAPVQHHPQGRWQFCGVCPCPKAQQEPVRARVQPCFPAWSRAAQHWQLRPQAAPGHRDPEYPGRRQETVIRQQVLEAQSRKPGQQPATREHQPEGWPVRQPGLEPYFQEQEPQPAAQRQQGEREPGRQPGTASYFPRPGKKPAGQRCLPEQQPEPEPGHYPGPKPERQPGPKQGQHPVPAPYFPGPKPERKQAGQKQLPSQTEPEQEQQPEPEPQFQSPEPEPALQFPQKERQAPSRREAGLSDPGSGAPADRERPV